VARTITSAYRFLPKQIREIDERDGGRFLQRFLAGVDAVWSDFDGRAREMLVGALIPALLRRAPADTLRGRLYDQMLRHLLWLLGFTTDLAAVTRELTDDDYARLVQIAVPLWKENATEQGIVSTVRLFTGRPVKLLDWFDLRSIVGVTGLWEKQRGTDPWVMGGQFGEYDERLMHLRIMDWPGLNKAAILALLEATHACGERLEVIFPAFLDDFSFGKMLWTSQGTFPGVLVNTDTDPALEIAAGREYATADGSDDWINYMLAVRVTPNNAAQAKVRFRYSANNPDIYYSAEISLGTKTIVLKRVNAGPIATTIATSAVIPWLVGGIPFKLRIDVQNETDGIARIRIYLDRDEVINVKDTVLGIQPLFGSFALENTAAGINTALFDDPELILLPSTVHRVGKWD
jgi:hypothetical protein